jgi:hypothetical protein
VTSPEVAGVPGVREAPVLFESLPMASSCPPAEKSVVAAVSGIASSV